MKGAGRSLTKNIGEDRMRRVATGNYGKQCNIARESIDKM